MKYTYLYIMLFVVLSSCDSCKEEPEPAPVIEQINPKEGVPQTNVTITGKNFEGISSIRFNGKEAFFRINGSSIIAQVPLDATSGKITIANRGGLATSSDSFFVLKPHAPPVLNDIYPVSNPVDWPLVIEGENLNSVTSIKFNNINAPIDTSANDLLATRIPSNLSPGIVTMTLTTPGGAVQFAYQILSEIPFGPPPPHRYVRKRKARYVPKITDNWQNEFNRPGYEHSIQLNEDDNGGYESLTINGFTYESEVEIGKVDYTNKTIVLYVWRSHDSTEDIYTGEYVDSDVPNQDNPTKQRIIFTTKDKRQFVMYVGR